MRREFSAKTKVQAFQRCGGYCEVCTRKLLPGDFHYDHSIADGLTGANDLSNCRVLCRSCHAVKTKGDVAIIAKAKRRERRNIGIRKPSQFACSRDSRWKRKLDGSVVPR